MKILITGISGLLGSCVARDAHNVGHEIVGLSRNISKLKFDFPVELIKQDLTDKKLQDDLLSGIDIVIHCAANTQMGTFQNINQNLVNRNAVKKLIEASINAKVKRFIHVSTANTCVPGNKTNPGNEANKLGISPDNLNYINSKIKGERTVLSAFQNNELDVIIMNPTFIINPFAGNKSSNKLLHYGLNKSVLFHPKGGKNIVDVRDVSKAIIASIKNGKAGENYILANKNYSYKEFYKLVLKEQNRKAILLPIPAILLLVLGGITSIIESISKRPINLNLNSAKLLNSNHYYDYSKAAKDLGFFPRDIRETIKDKIDNFKL